MKDRFNFVFLLLSSWTFQSIFVIVFFIYSLGIYVPWNILTFDIVLADNSWEFILHYAFENNWQFGDDIVFTFGPLGFIYGGNFYPSTYSLLISFWIWMTFIFTLFWTRLIHRSTIPLWITIPLMFVIPGVAMNGAINYRYTYRTDGVFLLVGFMCLLNYFFIDQESSKTNILSLQKIQFIIEYLKRISIFQKVNSFTQSTCGSFTTFLLIITLGAGALIKFTFLIHAIVCVSLISLDQLFRNRKFPIPMLILCLVFLTGWILSGQQLLHLLPYFKTSLELATYHSEAMQLESNGSITILFMASTIALLFFTGTTQWKQDWWRSGLFMAGLSWSLWVSFKAGFVRFHFLHLPSIAGFSLLVSVALWLSFSKSVIYRFQAILIVIAFTGWVIIFGYSVTNLTGRLPQFIPDTLKASGTGLSNLWKLRSGRGHLMKAYQDRLESVRQSLPIAKLNGTTDTYPFGLEFSMIACGLPYIPRPVFQSYLAYSPFLAELNASHLRSPKSPEYILLFLGATDNRSPLMEDSLSWPEILTRYELLPRGTNRLPVLKKRSRSKSFHKTQKAAIVSQFGQEIPVPAEWQTSQEFLWLNINVEKSIPGTIAASLYKPPIISLRVKTANGEEKSFRVLPALAKAGFFLIPNPSLSLLFSPFNQPASGQTLISSISIVCEANQQWYFQPNPSVTISQFKISD